MQDVIEGSDVCRRRTALFTAGVVLTTLHALSGWTFGAVLTGIAHGNLQGARRWLEAQGFSLVDFLLSWASLVGGFYMVLNTALLIACAGAWFGSRAWTWMLMVLSVVASVTSGPLSLAVAAITVFGAAQVLDQSRPFPSDPG